MTFRETYDQWITYLSRIDHLPTSNDEIAEKIKLCQQLIPRILEDIHEWDAYTKITREKLGPQIIEKITKYSTSDQTIRHTFLFLVRCTREKEINSGILPQGAEKEPLNYYNKPGLSEQEKEEKDYLGSTFIKSIVKDLELRIDEKRKYVEDLIQQWTAKTAEVTKQLEKGQSLVDRYQKQFNFVGISKAFRDLADQKIREKKKQMLLMIAISALLLFPPTFSPVA